ncbi:MAG: hypothetical protein U0271_42830 [Polyangiaceae bacterium]
MSQRLRALVRGGCALVAGAALGGAESPARADDSDPSDVVTHVVSSADDLRLSEGGHPYRVRFDPGSRVTLSAGLMASHEEEDATATLELGATLDYRNVVILGVAPDAILWEVDHRIISGFVRPLVHPAGDWPALDAVVYRLCLHRHSESPTLVLPFNPPVSVDFPLDVGLDAEIGRVAVMDVPIARPDDGALVPWVRVGVTRASFLLDPWRSGRVGRSLTLGIGVRYDVELAVAPDFSSARVLHRVAPLTATSVRFRYQTDDGLLALDASAGVAPHWTSEDRWDVLADSTFRLDRTLIAINDQPIGAFAELDYHYIPTTFGEAPLHDARGSVGLSASFNLK